MDLLGYDTRGDSEKYEYLGENETKIENVLTCWSVAQIGSNDDTKWGSKISLDYPFNKWDFGQGPFNNLAQRDQYLFIVQKSLQPTFSSN